MPLHVARLRDSDLAAEEHPEACWYAVLLWAASWHQLPTASLPDNDAVLTKLIGLGRDLKTFRKHKVGALRGFVLCDDGRLYHPIVAEQALVGWRGKLEQRWRTECARIKKRNQRDETDVPLPSFAEFMETLPEGSRLPSVPEDGAPRPQGQEEVSPGTGTPRPRGNDIQETEKGTRTGTGIPSSEPNGSGAEAPSDEDMKAKAWWLALRVLMDRGMQNRAAAAKLVGKWAKDYALEHIAQASQSAWDVKTLDPISYITVALDRLRSETTEADAFTSPTETRQRLWMQDFRAYPAAWREHERGPKPGQPNCRVSPEIQREFGIESAGPQAMRGAA